MRTGSRIATGLIVAALVAAGARAERARTWVADADALARGTADGVAVTARGRLFAAPRLVRLADVVPGRPAHVWATAGDASGTLYLGTGPDGAVVRLTPSGRASVLFSAEEPLVTALALLPDGSLLAAGAPGGVVYRVGPDGRGSVWSRTGEPYVWSLVVDDDGRVWAGTGDRGRVLRIGDDGDAETFFDADEAHVVSLLPAGDGRLYAGGAGRGLVYEIDADGNALVVHDDDLAEVTGLALDGEGRVWAALMDAPRDDVRRPAVRLRLPDGVEVGTATESVRGFQETTGPVVTGVIEGLPEAPAPERPTRGRVVRVDGDGVATEIWSSTSEAVFALARDGRRRMLFGAGEPGRLYAVDPVDDDVALLATLREAQITGLQRTGGALIAATSNPAAAYLVEAQHGETGVYVSPAFDAGGPARWGSISWTASGRGGRVELYTRTGNSVEPDATWSAWSPTLTDPRGSAVVNPEGRYVQWRARWIGAAGDLRIERVALRFAPFNRAPRVRDFAVAGESVAGAAALSWLARDADGDGLNQRVEFRPEGGGEWRPGPSVAVAERDSDRWQAGGVSWDTTGLDEGSYRVRLIVDDAPSNHPGASRATTADSILRVVVDRTPPTGTVAAAGDDVEVTVSDAVSGVAALELLSGETVRATLRPDDGVYDGVNESFRFDRPRDGAYTLRARDAAGNVADLGAVP